MRGKSTRKYDVWGIHTEAGIKKVEVRVSTGGALVLSAVMDDGTILTGTDVDTFRREVNEYVVGLHKLDWEKVLVVSTADREKYGRENYINVTLDWGICHRAQFCGKTVWKKKEGSWQMIDYYHGIHAGGPGSLDRVIPYTEAGEAFLRATVASLEAFSKKIEDFFQSDQLQLCIERNALLLPAKETT